MKLQDKILAFISYLLGILIVGFVAPTITGILGLSISIGFSLFLMTMTTLFLIAI